MKTKKMLIRIIAIVLCLSVIGVAVFYVWDNRVHSSSDKNKDLLVGVFLTTDSVFENNSYAKLRTEEDKYYATLVEKTDVDGVQYYEYVFEGLNGYGLYYTLEFGQHITIGMTNDTIFNNEEALLFAKGHNYVLDATVYFCKEELSFCLNPVYQDSDGRIYTILNGEGGCYIRSDVGTTFGSNYSDSAWYLRNNKPEKYTSEINVNLEYKNLVKETSFTQFTKDNKKLRTDTFKLGEIPESYPLSDDVAYIIVDTVYTDTEGNEYTEKEYVQIGKDELYLYTLNEDGIYSRVYF